MPPTFIALVPAKGAGSKSRLSPILSATARAALSAWMLERALAALRAVPAVGNVRLVSPDRALAPLAARWGAAFVPEAARGLNEALQIELDRCLSEDRAALILFADLPRIAPAAIEALLDAAERAELVLAPDRAKRGTNALVLRRGPWRLRYGPDSFEAHLNQARTRGLRVHVFEHPALAHDLDTPDDWAWFEGTLPEGKKALWRT